MTSAFPVEMAAYRQTLSCARQRKSSHLTLNSSGTINESLEKSMVTLAHNHRYLPRKAERDV